MNLQEMLRKRSSLAADAKNLRSQIEAGGEISADVQTRFDSLISEIQGLDTKIAEAQRREQQFSFLDSIQDQNLEPRVSDDLPHSNPANSRNGHRQFSIVRAVNTILSGRALNGIEGEVTAELVKRRGGDFSIDGNQFLVPHSLPMRRDITTDAASGGDSIQTTVPNMLIDYLRNALTVRGLGASVLSDLKGPLAIPRLTTIASGGWKAEGTAFDESSPVLDQVALTPKRVGTYVEVTRTLMRQSSLDIENMVRNDLTYAVAAAIDAAAINGSGIGAVPSGVITLQTSQVEAIGANGGPITWDAVVGLESRVAIANALTGRPAYLTTAGVRGSMKTTPKESGYPVYILDESGMLNGNPLAASAQVPSTLTKGTAAGICHAMIFGDWSSLMIGLWGGSLVTVNPYSLDTSGVVRLVIEQLADVAFRQINSFAVCKDITI